MKLLSRVVGRVRTVFTRRRVDDLDEELADYLARSVERRAAAGVAPEEATRLARAEIGSTAAIRDHVRDVSRTAALGTIWQDIRYGARLMNRSRGFTLVAALVLSLGIGTTTALFSIINALLFTPLTVPEPDELVSVYTQFPDGRFGSIFKHEFEAFVESGAELADFTSRSFGRTAIAVDDDIHTVTGEYVEGGYFFVLHVGTAIGRPLGPLDAQPGADSAIVISYDFWQSRFRGEPVLGRQVRLLTGSTPTTTTIVGVAAKGFRGLSDPWSPTQYWITRPLPLGNVFPIARLKPGVTRAQFRAFLDTITIALQDRAREDRRPRRWAGVTIEQLRFAVFRTADVRIPLDPNATLVPPRLLAALIVVVTLILTIATANVGGLMLARGVTRNSEIAVRRALGAGGRRVSRQLITEGVVLAGAGGVIGVGVAWGLLAGFRATVPPAYALDTPIDWRVLVFAVAVCVLAGVFVAMGPAVQSLRANVVDALGGGPASTKQIRTRLRYWVVVPQVALSLVLLVIAGVHLRVLVRVERASFGYETDGRIVFTTTLMPPNPLPVMIQMPADRRRVAIELAGIRARRLATEVQDRVAAIPGVQNVGIAERMPFQPFFELGQHRLIGTGSDVRVHASETAVSGSYFDTMRIRLRSGRTFTDHDVSRTTPPVVVSRSLATGLWPSTEAVGKVISFETDPRYRSTASLERLEVVGVVDDVFPVLGTLANRSLLYRFALNPGLRSRLFVFGHPGLLVVSASGDRDAIVRQVRETVAAIDPFAEITNIRTTEHMVGELLFPRRMAAGMLVIAGAVGLALAAIGLYGLMSYSVAQREREIGIRATLGAAPRDLVGLILRESARVMSLGGIAGIALAAIAVRLSAGLMPGLPRIDLLAIVIVPIIPATVILAASYLPARRAARVDPIAVLRAT